MRSVQTRQFIYVFNAWSDGQRRFPSARFGGLTCRAMQRVAISDAAMAARVRHLELRSVEEFFDLRTDPHCLTNLLGGNRGNKEQLPEHQEQVDRLRAKLREWMVRVEDPALAAFDNRHDPDELKRFMQQYTERATKEVETLREYEKKTGYRF